MRSLRLFCCVQADYCGSYQLYLWCSSQTKKNKAAKAAVWCHIVKQSGIYHWISAVLAVLQEWQDHIGWVLIPSCFMINLWSDKCVEYLSEVVCFSLRDSCFKHLDLWKSRLNSEKTLNLSLCCFVRSNVRGSSGDLLRSAHSLRWFSHPAWQHE